MGNAAGVFAVLAAFTRPGIVVPHAIVADIGEIDWERLRKEGVEDVVIDKDNCVTLPLRDHVAPGLESAWCRLTQAGFRSILIVSNSAGSSDDPLAIGAEHLARTLGQSVLAHPAKKPSIACAKQILDVLSEPRTFESSYRATQRSKQRLIAVVGDRVTTDIVLAARLNKLVRKGGQGRVGAYTGAVGILTTRVLEPERLTTRIMRSAEMWCLSRLEKRKFRPSDGWRSSWSSHEGGTAWQDIVHDERLVRQATELEAASQIRPDIREVFLRKSQELLLTSARSLGYLTKVTALFLARNIFRFASHAAYLASRGRIGAPTTFPSMPVLRKPSFLNSGSSFSLSNKSVVGSGESGGNRRSYTTARMSRVRYQHTKASRPSTRPRFTTAQKVGYFSALVLVPTCWYGGFYLNEYLAWRQAEKQESPSESVTVAQEVHRQPLHVPQSAKTPSLANAFGSTSKQQSFEIQSLNTERLLAARELADLDDKLARIRQRREREQA